MDIIGARDELSLIDWETVLQGTVNEGWERLKTYCYGFRASVFHVKPKVKRKSCGWAIKHLNMLSGNIKYLKNIRIPDIPHAGGQLTKLVGS